MTNEEIENLLIQASCKEWPCPKHPDAPSWKRWGFDHDHYDDITFRCWPCLLDAIAALSSPCACGGEKPLAEVDGWMNECDVDGIRSSIDALPWVSCAALLGESDPDNGFIVPVRHIILERKPCS